MVGGQVEKVILNVITGLGRGGAEMMLLRLVPLLREAGLPSRVVSLQDGGEVGHLLKERGIEVKGLGMIRSRPSWSGLRALVRDIAHTRPALIQGWMYHGNVAATVAAKLARYTGPICWNVRHSAYPGQREKPLTRLLLRTGAWISPRVDAIVYCSAPSARQHRRIGYTPRRETIIPNGFHTGLFRPDRAARAATRAALEAGGKTPLIGLVGRWHPLKDQTTFLRAAALVRQSYPRARFVLAGRGLETGNAELMRAIDEAGVGDAVHLLGERRDVPALLAGLDLFCLSSVSESFPNVVGEAMACGVPCVVTNVGETGEIVGDTGVVVPARDPRALADGLVKLLKEDAQSRRRRGERARNRIVARYSMDIVLDRYLELYRDLLGEATGRTSP